MSAGARLAALMGGFGRGSIAFDGSTGYLLVGSDSNLALGSGDFTLEFFVKVNPGGQGAIVDGRATGNGPYPNVGFTGGGMFFYVDGNFLVSGGTVTEGVWTHFAVARQSGTTRLFIGGALVDSAADATDYQQISNRPSIGAQGWNLGDSHFGGKMSNLRIVVGTAVYTGAFTPPAAPLSPISGTQLLCCLGGFLDFSANHYTLTASGGVTISGDSPF